MNSVGEINRWNLALKIVEREKEVSLTMLESIFNYFIENSSFNSPPCVHVKKILSQSLCTDPKIKKVNDIFARLYVEEVFSQFDDNKISQLLNEYSDDEKREHYLHHGELRKTMDLFNSKAPLIIQKARNEVAKVSVEDNWEEEVKELSKKVIVLHTDDDKKKFFETP